MDIEEISIEEFASLYLSEERIGLIDVREEEEFEEMCLEKAALVPLSNLSMKYLETYDKSLPLYILCLSGGRSYYAAQILKSWGFLRPISVQKGMKGAIETGLPIKEK